ncbi:MAG: SPOR domain-containing protein [Tannerellaceae bacterium]|nr:SPOR domain-containing protein [Tannerellaceae bacterium]
MNKISCIVLFFALFVGSLHLHAQSAGGARTIFDALQESGPGEGEVIVNQSPEIRRLVGSRLYGDNIERSDTETYIKIQGFRTQVFSGNNQRSSKDEAFAKEQQVKELFPDLPTYVTYTAPFWRLRVGDFRSHEEAYRMLHLLRDAFPSFGKEMYIVREEVKIPLQQY